MLERETSFLAVFNNFFFYLSFCCLKNPDVFAKQVFESIGVTFIALCNQTKPLYLEVRIIKKNRQPILRSFSLAHNQGEFCLSLASSPLVKALYRLTGSVQFFATTFPSNHDTPTLYHCQQVSTGETKCSFICISASDHRKERTDSISQTSVSSAGEAEIKRDYFFFT